jgi:hypothetical protein
MDLPKRNDFMPRNTDNYGDTVKWFLRFSMCNSAHTQSFKLKSLLTLTLWYFSRNWNNYSLQFSDVQWVCWWVRTFTFMYKFNGLCAISVSEYGSTRKYGDWPPINTYNYDVLAFPPSSWTSTNLILSLSHVLHERMQFYWQNVNMIGQ